MGHKLAAEDAAEFLGETETVAGIVGGCYCCGQNIHVTFKHLEAAPMALIDDSNFFVVVCDQCEQDVLFLEEAGIKSVSYDLLWVIQDPLELELSKIEQTKEITEEIRDKVLLKLYKEAEKKSGDKSDFLKILAYDGDQ